MSKTSINSLTATNSADTRAELLRVAAALSQARLQSSAPSTHASISLKIDTGAHTTEPAAITVSVEALDTITRLIAKAGSKKDGAFARRRRGEELTTQAAADHLGVSRPYLVKLLDAGKIPHRRIGRYRRVHRSDVERFEREEQARQRVGLEALAAFTQEIGLEY